MENVDLGRPGTSAVVDSRTCVKSGLPTDERRVLTGPVVPWWSGLLPRWRPVDVDVLRSFGEPRYRLSVPFSGSVLSRFRRYRLLAWLVIAAGLIAAFFAARAGWSGAGWLLLISVAGYAGTVVNGHINHVGVRFRRDGTLRLLRVHRLAAQEIRRSTVAPW